MRAAFTQARLAVVLAVLMTISLLAVPAGGAPGGESSQHQVEGRENGLAKSGRGEEAATPADSTASTDAAVLAGRGLEYLIVELSSAPLAHDDTTKVNGRFDPESRGYANALARLQREHEKFLARLVKVAPEVEVVNELFITANAISLRLNGVDLNTLSRVPGIKRLNESGLYWPTMDESLPLIGADDTPEDSSTNVAPADAGAGIKVGIIDAGIDAEHPFFGCLPVGFDDEEETSKVVFGGVYFSGNGFLPQLPAVPAFVGPHYVPAPGLPFYFSDPHGTHVAGTVGGCITTVGAADESVGAPFSGTEVSGVAPGAQLWDYNVFPMMGAGMVAFGGSAFSHDIAAAIEQAALDDMDVINMSLGGGVQGPHDFLAEVANAAVDAGVVVVTSAGNEGPNYWTVGSPGSAEKVIAVGASTNKRTLKTEVRVPNGSGTDVYPAFSAEWGDFDGTPAPLVDWSGSDNEACSAADADDHAGEYVLIARGTCTFTEKVASAYSSGAAGAIIYSDSRDPGGMAGDGDIPAVMISNEDGLVLEDRLESEGAITGVVVTPPFIDATVPNNLAGFSSRGPAPFTAVVKPDVVAPGVDILSSVFTATFYGFSIEPSWALYGGTSMASPHVAGVAARLREAHPDWDPAMVKSALVTTASNLADYGSSSQVDVFRQGGGLVHLPSAADASVFFEPANVSFGIFEGKKPVTGSVAIAVTNELGVPLTCYSASSDLPVVVTPTLSPGTLTVNLTLGRDPGELYMGGYITVECGVDGTYRLPWGAVVDRKG